jgi:A/G-specific adenine glycosylase
MTTGGKEKFFVSTLKKWNLNSNKRQMPWKGEQDPYKIWLSEIILQQTRVEQGLTYYQRFVEAFPTIRHLANASETEVFKLWEGLGYYTRCKNLLFTAKYIANDLKGIFPKTYEDILMLKGIGPYTAAAISSFAFNLPNAVVDGNVFRVLARFFGIATPIDSTAGKKLFNDLASQLLDKVNPAIYNQALMDFGAVICKAQLPLCSTCVLQKNCRAYNEQTVHRLPVKQKKIVRKYRWLYYYIIEHDNCLYIRKREMGDIWENLYEFVLIEADEPIVPDKNFIPATLTDLAPEIRYKISHISPAYRQLLTHQTIQGQFIHVKIERPLTINGYQIITTQELLRLPFPKFISNYLKDKNVSLNLFQNKKDRKLFESISTS